MLRRLKLLATVTICISATPAMANTNPFGVDAVDNAVLAQATAGYASSGFGRNARAAIDQNARYSFDAMASINRVTFDNWFAREGADLLAASAFGRPLP